MSGMRVLDVDERGRLLTAATDGDQSRLVETEPGGKSRELAVVSNLTRAAYLPEERTAVVQHGSPAMLSLLGPNGKMAPLVGAPDHDTELLGVLPGRIVYRANRRHRLLYTVVIRNVLVGEEQAVYDRGGAVLEAAASANSRHIAIRLPRKLQLVDTMPVTEDDHVRLISVEPGEGSGHVDLMWHPDSQRLLATAVTDSTATVERWNVADQEWTTLVGDLPPDARAVLAPDARRIAVVSSAGVGFYEAEKGRFLRAAQLPSPGTPLWTPDSRQVVTVSEGRITAVVAESGSVRALTP
ncbi:hypothetical protein ACOBQX_18145 [Actinokineospora sp. G85]|uniref:hypothetical protein n=1 Tax=Actinokineospora sp. G85 TaxID=3406626 RepID=UPI003C753A97